MIPQSNPKAGYLAHREHIDLAVRRVLESGWYILGEEVAAFEVEFAAQMGAAWSVGVASGTDAIELALRALGVGVGDKVITVSHTAVATVAAIARIGATPLFVDIDAQRYTLDPDSLRQMMLTEIGQTAKAIVVVHLYGQAADLPEITKIARQYRLSIVEDCAQAHGASLNGQAVGTWGDLGCFSFYPTKNLGALGDGGAVIGNAPELQQKVALLRTYGWKERYISDEFGVNSRLDELQAAILRARLPFLDSENTRRRAIANRYDEVLSGLGIGLPWRTLEGTHVFHQYVIRTRQRDSLMTLLREHGVGTLVHYPRAVHQQPAYACPKYMPVSLTRTESVVDEILSLPMHPALEDKEIDLIASTLINLTNRIRTKATQ